MIDLRRAVAGYAARLLRAVENGADPTPAAEAADDAGADDARLLADLGELLDVSLGVHTLLSRAGRLAVPRLADWCAAYTARDDGTAGERVVAQGDDAIEETLAMALARAPLHPADPHPLEPVHQILATGEPSIVAATEAAALEFYGRLPWEREVLRSLSPGTLMVVPLEAGGDRIGAVAFIRSSEAEPYRDADLDLARAFCDRVAMAAANAIRFKAAVTRCTVAESAREEVVGMLESISNGFITLDPRGTVTYMNREAERMLAISREHLLGRVLWTSIPPHDPESPLARACRGVEERNRPAMLEISQSWTGESRWFEAQLFPLRPGVSICFRDITVRRKLELQLKQREAELQRSQRMEAIGRLAGGVAHDFNNLLMSIAGYTERSMTRVEPDDPLYEDLAEVRRAADRATTLTRQLLTYSRKQPHQPHDVNLATVLTNLERTLLRLVGEDIILAVRPDPNLGTVHVDPAQVEQIVLNLAVNARDAMPQGGRLTIELEKDDDDADDAVILVVSDSGSGIEPEVLPHIFEPFFTTKPQGTGLGLASVYGIVTQNGGSISVRSVVDRGTTFRIRFPKAPPIGDAPPAEARTARPSLGPPPSPKSRRSPRESGVILVAEDEASVRNFVCSVLRDCGYTVLDARTGVEGLAVARRYGKPIDLLLTDVVMPEMGGKDLAARLAEMQPDVKILFMSGYADNELTTDGVVEAGTRLLDKPFTSGVLAERVQELLTGDTGPPGGRTPKEPAATGGTPKRLAKSPAAKSSARKGSAAKGGATNGRGTKVATSKARGAKDGAKKPERRRSRASS